MDNKIIWIELMYVCMYVCVCVCVCECVFAGKWGPCSAFLHSDRGRPRIGELVQMVANSICKFIWECAKYTINRTCTRYVHGSSFKFHTHVNLWSPRVRCARSTIPRENVRHTSPRSPVIFQGPRFTPEYQYVCVCVYVCMYVWYMYVCMCMYLSTCIHLYLSNVKFIVLSLFSK